MNFKIKTLEEQLEMLWKINDELYDVKKNITNCINSKLSKHDQELMLAKVEGIDIARALISTKISDCNDLICIEKEGR